MYICKYVYTYIHLYIYIDMCVCLYVCIFLSLHRLAVLSYWGGTWPSAAPLSHGAWGDLLVTPP